MCTVNMEFPSMLMFKEEVQHFRNYAYLLSDEELDEKTDTTLVSHIVSVSLA